MTLRLKFTIYLIAVHLLFGGMAVYVLLEHRQWLLAIEAVFVVSLAIGLRMIRKLLAAVELINTGAQFIQDSDFTSRFREMGQPEMDRLIGVYNQMADHLRAERTRMQEQNFFLEKVLSASPTGIITLDFDGRIATVNPAAGRFLQASPGELAGRRLGEIENPIAAGLTSIGAGESGVIALSGRRRVKCRRSQFLDRGFPRDFLILEELTEELRQAEKSAYEKVIRMMSHEVNNSIGSANSLLHSSLHYSDQLRDEDRADFENAIRVVINRTDQLNAFMRNFADVFRLPQPRLSSIDINVTLREIALLFKAECEERRIEIDWETEDSAAAPVRVDRSQIEQVLVNILKNAIEAIGTDGRITIVSGRQNGRPFISIRDTGCGLSPAVRANLFTPFFSTKDNGQGIGLTMVQEILELHGFEFSLDTLPGRGTEFNILFRQEEFPVSSFQFPVL